MFEFLSSLNWITSLTILALFFISITAILSLFIRKIGKPRHLQNCHEITDPLLGGLSALYSVLLGFTIVSAQARFSEMEKTSEMEFCAIGNLYKGSKVFSFEDQVKIKYALNEYIQSIVHDEWGRGNANPETTNRLYSVFDSYYSVALQGEKQPIWYEEAVQELGKLGKLRLDRLIGSRESLGKEMWTILVLGGLAVIVIGCFFSPNKPIQHIVMMSFVSIIIGFCLYVIYSLDSAFTDEGRVRSKTLKNVIELVEPHLAPQ